MKKIILTLFTLGLLINSFAQDDNIKGPALGIHFFFNDFKTAAELRASGIVSVIRTKNWKRTNQMSPGLAVSYVNGISKHMDFISTASGSFVEYPIPGKVNLGPNKFLLEVAAAANFKLLTDKYLISPYVTLGAGVSKYGGYYGAFVPAGVGLQVNLFDEAFLLINSQYRIPVTENVAYHLYHSIGVAGNIVKRKVVEPAPLPPPPAPVEEPKDRDKDGVLDENDKCPDVAGIVSMQGCPDQDGDGVTDADDKCPATAGLSKYQGCPIPDTDKDGINDENDKCIEVAGVARYQGCPVPDTDKDGVNDEEDKCPGEAGPVSNYGCPVIEEAVVTKVNKAAQNIFFVTGSAKLLAKSNASLNSVVSILNDNPSYKVDIDGHTDNVGKAELNQTLSEARANAVRNYFVSKGIDESRLIAAGHGFDVPIADNKTAAGRAKNRRVEMKLRNY